jgi:rod shape-determining protein MreC
MESLITRYRNVSILVAILFAQVLGLAVQVRRSQDNESTRLIRVWAVGAITPFEKAVVGVGNSISGLWHNYVYLRGVRQENRDLRYEIENLRLKQVRLSEDAAQAQRLQVLLGFKEQFISKTVAAQVIGFSGSDLSRAVYIDKGVQDGIGRDMVVITADGVVGKVLRVYSSTSLVLLINDQTSGVGAILQNSRLQGVLRGTPSGEVVLEKILSDEQVQPGEPVLTSGGDQIFPKGLPAGVVIAVSRGPESFLNIRLHAAANLGKLEEVLVITRQESKTPVVDSSVPMRAVDILAQRLPSVPDKPAADASQTGGPADSETSHPALTANPPLGPGGASTPPSASAKATGQAKPGAAAGRPVQRAAPAAPQTDASPTQPPSPPPVPPAQPQPDSGSANPPQ